MLGPGLSAQLAAPRDRGHPHQRRHAATIIIIIIIIIIIAAAAEARVAHT